MIMIDLKNAENELLALLNQDKNNWVLIYRLMDQVEKEKAYEATNRSYTQWVNSLADKAKVHVSLLWARKKAGNAYDEYAKRLEAKGIQAPALEEISVSPDNINLVAKIAGSNSDVADDLIAKVATNELHRADLKKAWADVKEERLKKGISPTRKSRHSEEVESGVSMTTIIKLELMNSSEWLSKVVNDYYKYLPGPLYKALPELAVRPGTSKSARRIDMAALETFTNEEIPGNHDLTLHGIEIKISKGDLLHDSKMQEYTDYCDYFWVAIPEDLIEEAKGYALEDWGILAYHRNKSGSGELRCIKKANKLNAPMREFALVEAIRRKLK